MGQEEAMFSDKFNKGFQKLFLKIKVEKHKLILSFTDISFKPNSHTYEITVIWSDTSVKGMGASLMRSSAFGRTVCY